MALQMITQFLEYHDDVFRNHALVYGFVCGATLSSFYCVRAGLSCWNHRFVILKHSIELALAMSVVSVVLVHAERVVDQNFGSFTPVILLRFIKR